MSKKVAEQLDIVRAYVAKPTKKGYSKADDAVVELWDLSEKKRTREAAREALLEIVKAADLELAGHAMYGLAEVLGPDDTDLIPLLRERLAIYHDSDIFYLKGLLAILGPAVYPDALQLVRDSGRSMGSRSTVVEYLDEITGIPFARDLLGRSVPDSREEHLHLEELAEWEANGFAIPEIVIPTDELAALGITLPDDYAAFLLRHHARERYEYDSASWWLLSAAELCEPRNVDGQLYPAVQQLKGYAQTFRECTGEDATVDAKGKAYPVGRLAGGVVIGTSDSGDVLYLDPADPDSVWIYHHDGGDVKRAAKTFATWHRKARKE